MKDVVNEIEILVSKIDRKIFGTWNTLNLELDVCKSKWARVGRTITSLPPANVSYNITDLNRDENLSVSLQIPSGNYLLPNPFFISGTQIATNNEWTKVSKNLLTKTPLIWLLETLRMEKFGRGDTRDFESDIRLFFLDETNPKQYYTKDHHENVVLAMEELALAFLEQVAIDKTFKTIDAYELHTFSRFGSENSEGMFKNILDANLSGVELRLNLCKYKMDCVC